MGIIIEKMIININMVLIWYYMDYFHLWITRIQWSNIQNKWVPLLIYCYKVMYYQVLLLYYA
jgi:hypothetical protein